MRKAGFAVDLYEVLPAPFGLVGAGVVPDHPKIKSVTHVYEKAAGRDVCFVDGAELGRDISREQVRSAKRRRNGD